MQETIRILHVLGTTNLGGAESRVMDIYRTINREKIQFDFLVHTEQKGYYDEEIKSLGGHIYRLPRFKVYNWGTYKKAVEAFFRSHHHYRAIQGHMTSTASIYLPIAKKNGILITIAHARSAGVDKGVKGLITRLLRHSLYKKCDYCFACSKLAGISVFGKKRVDDKKVIIIPNAIQAEKYRYDQIKREQIRTQLNIGDCFVIGHIGRFSFMKNHSFLIDTFNELVKKEPNSVLLLLGDGDLRSEMEEKVRKLGLTKKVFFLGNQSDVAAYCQAMDYFVFPSIFEGLPGTVVEAQAAGLKCLISDTITPEVDFTKLVKRDSIQKNPAIWADEILKNRIYEREDTFQEICDNGFDVVAQSRMLSQFYETGDSSVFR